jgi:hypothetical protein
VKSNVSGKVIKALKGYEGRVTDKNIVIIDSEADSIELKRLKRKRFFLSELFKLTKASYDNLTKILDRKRENYKKFLNLRTKSQLEKDREFYDLINTENSYLSLREKALNYKIQIEDIDLRTEVIRKSMRDKKISGKSLFIEKLLVDKNDFVTMGTPIFIGRDLSKAKLTLFLKKEDIENIQSRKIYIDEVLTGYKFDKIWKVSDENYISSYRAEIIIDEPKQFSKLIKVELK